MSTLWSQVCPETDPYDLWKQVASSTLIRWEEGHKYFYNAILGDYRQDWKADGFSVIMGQTLMVVRVLLVDDRTLAFGLFVPEGPMYDGRTGPSILLEMEQKSDCGHKIEYEAGHLIAKAGDADIEKALGEGRAVLITSINTNRPFLIKFST